MVETRRLKNALPFIETISSFVLSRKFYLIPGHKSYVVFCSLNATLVLNIFLI